jgi:hypothetical protein
VRPGDIAVREDHQRPTKLRRVANWPGLKLPGAHGGQSALGNNARRNEARGTGLPSPRGPVALSALVGENRDVQVLAATKVRGLLGRRLADEDEPRAGRLKLLASAIQLERVLLAENSAVVAKPDERHRSVAPQIAQTDRIAVLVGQDDVRKAVGTRRRLGPLPS